MGVFKTRIAVVGRKRKSLEAVVDTGATFTTLPAPLLKVLGFAPDFEQSLRFADGRVEKRPVGPVRLRMDGVETVVPVVFGRPRDAVLLGATTLEIMGFVVDPVAKKLVRTQGYAVSTFKSSCPPPAAASR